MSIFNYFLDIQLTNDQQKALEKLQHFLESDDNIFMLKGYAGTGKTTLIKGILRFLDAQNSQYQVMAPTGRAAKILRNKVGCGETIHSTIYELENVNFSYDKEKKKQKEDNGDESYKFIFPIKNIGTTEGNVLIIDEASMISSRQNKHPLFQFGTEILLQDILTYANCKNIKTKIIFVGDPAQLPPVGDNKSWAFEPRLFISKGLSVCEVELTQVVRQSDNNILKNATLIRSKIEEENPNELVLSFDKQSFIKTSVEDITTLYTENNPIPQLDNDVIISFSNMQCYHYNNAIREVYFPNQKTIQSGDIIQIISNNYKSYPTDVFNGDFAHVLSVNNNAETISAPVSIHGKRKTITLQFREVEIKLDHFNEPFKCLIIDSLLNSTNRDLTIYEYNALYISFIMRFDKEQKRRAEQGLPVYKRYDKEFKDLLLADKYMNAIRCKYGYAITCHKAQGGEWNNTIVDYSGRVSLKEDPLRWCYTATTRAINACYAVNPPHFNSFSKFEINNIATITKIPKEAYNFKNVHLSPFHNENQHRCKSKLYWDIVENMAETNLKVKALLSRDYLERYTISDGENDYVIEGHHNGAGVFTKGFNIVTEIKDEQLKSKITNIFKERTNSNLSINYNPTGKLLANLYSIIQSICSDLDIDITNIVEYTDKYFVIYFFRTDNICSYIQFYFNGKEQLTKALPRTFSDNQDHKLEQLITKIKDYVI